MASNKVKTDNIAELIKSFSQKKKIHRRLFTPMILEYLNSIYPNKSLWEQFYLLINNLTVPPICEYNSCDNYAEFNKSSKKYARGCCQSHKQKISMLEIHGVENPMYLAESKSKLKQTNLRKYGCENVSSNETIKEKKKETCLLKFGETTNLKCSETKEKIKITNLDKYGYENVSQVSEIKIKKENTCMENYGVKNPFSSNLVKLKMQQTNIKKYDYTHPMQNDIVVVKMHNSNLKKYGTKHYMHSHISNFNDYNSYNYIYNNFIKNNTFDYLSFCSYFNVSTFAAFKKINILGIEYNKHKQHSLLEKDLLNALKLLNIPIIENDRKILNGKELDIYIPSKNLAIEFNGMYWHSESKGKDKNYHLDKTIKCKEQGIQLIHIFDQEWIQFRTNIINYLYGLLQPTEQNNITIPIELTKDESKKFFDSYSITYAIDVGDINYALTYSGMVTTLISFSLVSPGIYKINTFGSSIPINMFNDFATIILNFRKIYKPYKITMSLDRRYFNGLEFIHMGFDIIDYGRPQCFYFKGTSPLSLEVKDETYSKIWDCGLIKLIWEKNK